MDVNDLRVIVTIVTFVAFIAIVIWAWSRKNQSRFDEAARLPFQELPAAGSRENPKNRPSGGGR